MAKFRKKPVVIEAIQYDGTEQSVIKILGLQDQCVNVISIDSGQMRINTLEGTMKANKHDWIIKGVNGELYPCKPDIFTKTYEPFE
jgi:hypothetical protein